MVVMRVAGLGIDAHRDTPLLVLAEAQGRRRMLPIWIAEPDAAELAAAHQHVHRSRPGTHELILAVLAASGRHLSGVAITALRDNIFVAELVLDDQARVSARPSDAVILALLAQVPIEAHEDVLDAAATERGTVIAFEQRPKSDTTTSDPTPGEPETRARIQEFRDFLDTVEPDDFDSNR